MTLPSYNLSQYILRLFKQYSLFVFLLNGQLVFAQGGGLNNIATRILNTDYLDKSGSNLTAIKGSPFDEDLWQPAILYLKGGGKIFVKKAKLNNYTGELHYIDDMGKELAPIENSVVQFDFVNEKDNNVIKKQYLFLPDPLKNNQYYFFEVHNQGKIKLLSRKEKFVFTENYDPLKGKTEQYFKTNIFYALLNDTILNRLSDLNREEVLKCLPNLDQKNKVEIKQKLKSIKEVVNFLDPLNQS